MTVYTQYLVAFDYDRSILQTKDLGTRTVASDELTSSSPSSSMFLFICRMVHDFIAYRNTCIKVFWNTQIRYTNLREFVIRKQEECVSTLQERPLFINR